MCGRCEICGVAARDLCRHYIKFHTAVAAFKSVRNKTCETTWHFAIVFNFENALYFGSVRDKILRGALFYVMYASGLPLLVSAMSASA